MSAALVLALRGDDSIGGACEECALNGMSWTVPEHSIEDVNAAGRRLITTLRGSTIPSGEDGLAEWRKSLNVVNNWRAAHAYPLNTFQMNLRRSAKRLCESPLVAQRIKRLISILSKLDRQPKMKLSQMQDVGGCRSVLDTVQEVGELVNYYQKNSAMKHHLASKDDYIAKPKNTGYRGVHLVYRYYSDKKVGQSYNGLRLRCKCVPNSSTLGPPLWRPWGHSWAKP
jgi:hypothetical protein